MVHGDGDGDGDGGDGDGGSFAFLLFGPIHLVIDSLMSLVRSINATTCGPCGFGK